MSRDFIPAEKAIIGAEELSAVGADMASGMLAQATNTAPCYTRTLPRPTSQA